MVFIEVTVGSTKQLLSIEAVKSIAPSGDGCTIYMREGGDTGLSYLEARESISDLERLIHKARGAVLRLAD